MDHAGTRTIETRRLVLRRFTEDDAEAMFRNWASDPEVTRFLTWPTHPDAGVSRQVLASWVAEYAKDDFYQWAICLAGTNEPIGSISVVLQREDVGMVHIGYCIGQPWWRQGVTSEALAALIRFFFTVVGANRVEARFDPRNENSGRVMASCGMRYEGTTRQSDRNNQGLCDASHYAILREDWEKAQAGAG